MTRNQSRRLPRPARRKPVRYARLLLEELEPRRLLSVTVQVDNGVTHQVINGWGTELTKEYEPGPDQVAQILSLVYGQLGLNLGQAGQLLEAPVPDFTRTADSDPDPFTINWNGFQGWQEQDMHDNWINAPSTTQDDGGNFLTARQLGYTDYFLGSSFPNIRWENPWLDAIRQSDPTTYLNKVAREALAYELYYQNIYGETPPLFQFGNEELTGNHAIYAGGTADSRTRAAPPGRWWIWLRRRGSGWRTTASAPCSSSSAPRRRKRLRSTWRPPSSPTPWRARTWASSATTSTPTARSIPAWPASSRIPGPGTRRTMGSRSATSCATWASSTGCRCG
jgi:hypothetical protein